MEWLEVFDTHDKPLNVIKPKPDIHRDGDWHRVSHVYVLNPAGEVLCNLRHPDKEVFASLWDLCFAGHVAIGETYRAGARRELEEESSLRVEEDALRYLCRFSVDGFDVVTSLFDREHTTLFVYQTDWPLDRFRFQEDEISELRFVPIPELQRNLRQPTPAFPIVPMPRMYDYELEKVLAYWNGQPVEAESVPVFNWKDQGITQS